jgi:hypothetical protein
MLCTTCQPAHPPARPSLCTTTSSPTHPRLCSARRGFLRDFGIFLSNLLVCTAFLLASSRWSSLASTTTSILRDSPDYILLSGWGYTTLYCAWELVVMLQQASAAGSATIAPCNSLHVLHVSHGVHRTSIILYALLLIATSHHPRPNPNRSSAPWE